MSSLVHLAKRAWSSLDNRPISGSEVERAERILNHEEFALWWSMAPRDQAHSLDVLDRFLAIIPWAKREEQAAALLHDVGKTVSRLNWPMRVLATVVGAKGKRFTAYHRHEEIGIEMLRGVSVQRTIDVLLGNTADNVADALREADEI